MLFAVLGLGVVSIAADNSPKPGVKKNPFFAYCMDTNDAKHRNLQQQAELLKELGYDGCGHLWMDNIPERLKTLDSVGLKLFHVYIRVNIAAGNSQPYDKRLKDMLGLFKGRGVALQVLFEGMKASDPAGDTRAVELMREIADLAKESGTELVIYPHFGNWVQSISDAVRVAKKVDRPNVGVMFNLCHWMKGDEERDLKKAVTTAMPYLKAVSLQGTDTPGEIRSGKGNWIQPLGSGSYDMADFLKILKEAGYKGPVGLQCYGIGGDARDHLSKSMDAWHRYNTAP